MPPCGQYVLLISILTFYDNSQQGELQLISFSFIFFIYFYFIFSHVREGPMEYRTGRGGTGILGNEQPGDELLWFVLARG